MYKFIYKSFLLAHSQVIFTSSFTSHFHKFSYTHFYMFIYKPFLQVHLQAIFTSSITSHIYKFE